MKVAVIGRSASAGSFASAITVAFGELGHETSTHELRMLGESRHRRLANMTRTARENLVSRSPRQSGRCTGALLREIREARPDLILTTLGRVTREEVDSWREIAPQARVVLWFPDALSNFGRQQAFGAGLRPDLRQGSVPGRLAPGARQHQRVALPRPGSAAGRHRVGGGEPDPASGRRRSRWPATSTPRGCASSRPSSMSCRSTSTAACTTTRCRSKIVRRFTGKYLSGSEKYQVFRDARGVLNNLHYAEVGGVNYRLFQATCCRGVVLIDDVPQVTSLLRAGSEVITFTSPQDLVRTMSEITDAELTAIGEAAHCSDRARAPDAAPGSGDARRLGDWREGRRSSSLSRCRACWSLTIALEEFSRGGLSATCRSLC